MSESIVLGGGCFWCLEAVYQRIKGVERVENGYAGGLVENPHYEQVCTGTTGHAEVVKITFDPSVINLETILKIFWTLHDPTTLNQQGADRGTQYRSIILYTNNQQKQRAEASREQDGQPLWPSPIVTDIAPLETFWPAESYHQSYFSTHPEQAYCQIVINPKLVKLKKKFQALLKD